MKIVKKLKNASNWDIMMSTGDMIEWIEKECEHCGFQCYIEKYVWDTCIGVYCHRCGEKIK
jgi:hypothetical protein